MQLETLKPIDHFEKTYEIHFGQIDNRGVARPSAVFELAQDAATVHAYHIGIGREDIDDYAFAIIGTVIGVGIYRLVAYISYEVNKREFLVDRTVSKSLLFHF